VIPSNTLIFRCPRQPKFAVVENNQARLRSVTIGRDFGASLEIVSGLTDNDEVILNPPDSLIDGQPVPCSGARTDPAV
jgi:multidrug efflux system membrane fusion protein